MYHHTAQILTSASSIVVVQHKACVTRTVVCSRQIVAQLLTVVFSSTTFVNVWNYTVHARLTQHPRCIFSRTQITGARKRMSFKKWGHEQNRIAHFSSSFDKWECTWGHPTIASSSVVVQYKACVTRTVVCSWQIVAQLLTVVFTSTTFVSVWNYRVTGLRCFTHDL